ncbi:putative T7SS-secreted protein [Streptomyces sp. WAC 06783]|uniref:putative T7SS-secreted protein n=1 Tax=Streptomyces sp. WAC 06783 TaxID=2203211 RepID=UPI000F73AA4F|nr:hypothetical protein [Streptomyces sp. WAC 06783]
MSDDWSGLGWNPTPGHPHLATNLADNLKRAAETLQSTHDLLDSLDKESSYWSGDAARAFAEKVADLPDYLKKAHASLKDAGGELAKWSDSLHDMKVKARNYEEDAKDARKKAERAEQEHRAALASPDLGLAGQHFETEAELSSAQHRLDAAQGKVNSAATTLDNARAKLQDLIDDAKNLESRHGETAQEHADRIRKCASDHAPDGGLWSGLKDWWDEHGGDLLTIAATVAGIAAIFVPVLAPVAIGLSLAAAAVHANQYIRSGKDMWPPHRRTSASGPPSAVTSSVPCPVSARPAVGRRPPSRPAGPPSPRHAVRAPRPGALPPCPRPCAPAARTSRVSPKPPTRRTGSSPAPWSGRPGSSAPPVPRESWPPMSHRPSSPEVSRSPPP